LAFRRGDIIIMDDANNGQSLNATGWASGTNDRTKQWGNFSAASVYVVPVVYVQESPKVAPKKPEPPRLFRPPTPEEPVSVALLNFAFNNPCFETRLRLFIAIYYRTNVSCQLYHPMLACGTTKSNI
jgi:hypothetical protein